MATNIPPHNLREVIDATLHLIDNPEAGVDDLMRFVTGPDFPTGAMILGRAGIAECYRTGRGSIRMRATAEIEEDPNGAQRILVSQLPFQTSVENDRHEDRRARERPPHRRNSRGHRPLRRRHRRTRHRSQARRERAGRTQPALQAHADADQLRGEHGRPGRRRPAAARPAESARGVRRAPGRGHHAAQRVPAEEGIGRARTSSRACSRRST